LVEIRPCVCDLRKDLAFLLFLIRPQVYLERRFPSPPFLPSKIFFLLFQACAADEIWPPPPRSALQEGPLRSCYVLTDSRTRSLQVQSFRFLSDLSLVLFCFVLLVRAWHRFQDSFFFGMINAIFLSLGEFSRMATGVQFATLCSFFLFHFIWPFPLSIRR